MTAAQVSQPMAGKPGQRKITSRPHSFITSRSITRSLTTFTERNRTTRTSASPAARIRERSDAKIGSSRAMANAASSCPIRATGTSFTQIAKGTLFATTKTNRSCRILVLFLSITRDTAPSIWPIVSNGFRRSCFLRMTLMCFTQQESAFSSRPITDTAGRRSAAI